MLLRPQEHSYRKFRDAFTRVTKLWAYGMERCGFLRDVGVSLRIRHTGGIRTTPHGGWYTENKELRDESYSTSNWHEHTKTT